jgi:hypothetical protein
MTRVLLDVSAHGFGHLAQSAPVVNDLAQRSPGLAVTVRADLPVHVLGERLAPAFRHITGRGDPGLAMTDALSVDRSASLRRYRAFHADWDRDVAHEADWLAREGFDLVVADVPYRSLAAAARAGIPGVALCSLDWAGVFDHYLGDEPGAAAIHEQILAAYGDAAVFLQPEPHMPMTYLANRRPIGPITAPRMGGDPDLRQRLAGSRRLGLVSLGGIPFALAPEHWPEDPDTLWVVPGAAAERPDQADPAKLGILPLELLDAANVVVTKPGYATFVEAAARGVDVLYLPRGDWPEEPFLMDWIHRHARAAALPRKALEAGDFAEHWHGLQAQPAPPAPECHGAAEAAGVLAGFLP